MTLDFCKLQYIFLNISHFFKFNLQLPVSLPTSQPMWTVGRTWPTSPGRRPMGSISTRWKWEATTVTWTPATPPTLPVLWYSTVDAHTRLVWWSLPGDPTFQSMQPLTLTLVRYGQQSIRTHTRHTHMPAGNGWIHLLVYSFCNSTGLRFGHIFICKPLSSSTHVCQKM